jgi:hypothetical protein
LGQASTYGNPALNMKTNTEVPVIPGWSQRKMLSTGRWASVEREMPMILAMLNSQPGQGQLVSRSYDPKYLARRALDETNIFRGSQKIPPLRLGCVGWG